MLNLVFIGSGAVAAEQVSYMNIDQYYYDGIPINVKGFVDFEDAFSRNYNLFHYKAPYLGSDETYELTDNDVFSIAIDNVIIRKRIAENLKKKGARFINLIHPDSKIDKNAIIGNGNIISPYCMIGPGVRVGDFNIMTSYSAISHHCIVGDYNSFSSVILCGDVVVGNGNTFNIKTTVIPSIVIGNDCVIQAGMVVDKNVPDGTTVFYRYKERIYAIPKAL